MKKTMIALALAASALTTASFAGELYTGVGTDGITVGYAQAVTPSMGVRVEANTLSYNANVNTNNVNYDGKLKFNTLALMYDYFPFASGFRVTTGAYIGDKKLDLNATGTGNYTINGTTYNATGESLHGEVKYPSVTPYLGIGYGHNTMSKGLSFFADMGVTYGKPSVSLTASPGLQAVAGQANIDAERQRIQDKVNKYNVYPVVKIGLGYAF